jgi:hypothetical protein
MNNLIVKLLDSDDSCIIDVFLKGKLFNFLMKVLEVAVNTKYYSEVGMVEEELVRCLQNLKDEIVDNEIHKTAKNAWDGINSGDCLASNL